MQKRMVVFMMSAVLAAGVTACDDDDEPSGPEVEAFVANMNGAQETPAAVNTTATGTGRVEFTATGLTWTVNVSNIANVTAAHIHAGAPGVSGPVVVNLNPTLTVTNGLLASGSATTTTHATITMDSIKKLIRIGQAYINVHNTANGAGHIRGVLLPE